MSPKADQEREWMREIPYASAIGSLMYATLCTKPNIGYVISVTSRYQSDLGEKHWLVVKTIFKYLRRTKDLVLSYRGSVLKIQGYSDSNFQSNVDNRKSTSEFIFTCNGGAVNWKSSKHSTTADSLTEAEYIATSEVVKEVVKMQKFMTQLGVIPNIVYLLTLYWTILVLLHK
ncbi:secreted RxLR effector protein 161-like [Pistacia vera]|uniref:secreted RxLR effector protein 161-like n=1 Tax=Pistacia vera TaxID=55513 RepID=UPI001262EC7D|nr:secreted RxLR effector protein 161-like [Pistacia vera]